ncbi:hypothetical protein GUJ93_ZPchr0010g9935 [Zizania palustris]|uniref:Uncharacterized protein n=1 Tax=Zizania palustris TaxID=103762 RepID=A0A8J5WCX3_ZIZPA|nr:hypothetical protein GUJ93_ZPchr0010g9935 [Zizania palustris]
MHLLFFQSCRLNAISLPRYRDQQTADILYSTGQHLLNLKQQPSEQSRPPTGEDKWRLGPTTSGSPWLLDSLLRGVESRRARFEPVERLN